MANERQRKAKKRFREAHPELFPDPEPTPSNPDKKKKKKGNKLKRKRPDSEDASNQNRSRDKKHPLRVPGMKPGESCFICRGIDHIAKDCPEKASWERNKICLLCRRRGHSLKNCPNKSDDAMDKKLCYNCGKTGHSLERCSEPLQEGGTKYASCFICKERGHLSKDCPKNAHGIYWKGGSCNTCGGITHLAKDCPNKSSTTSNATHGSNKRFKIEDIPTGQVTKLTSGDDLDDDFMVGESKEDNIAKLKKKHQGPKVVNFVG
ncbi:unnamed protein product [Cuscuta europaea]|uniref:CCHC-type domain-containing protein n=1 Tax=Cuscuta europaea TaxID=41803 RepID=A0A9P0YNT3_CUSEU|nr:unnamed protein product [Cuscuta europaea]